MLFVNNLMQNGSLDQKLKYLPDACSGKTIGGMGKLKAFTWCDEQESRIVEIKYKYFFHTIRNV